MSANFKGHETFISQTFNRPFKYNFATRGQSIFYVFQLSNWYHLKTLAHLMNWMTSSAPKHSKMLIVGDLIEIKIL